MTSKVAAVALALSLVAPFGAAWATAEVRFTTVSMSASASGGAPAAPEPAARTHAPATADDVPEPPGYWTGPTNAPVPTTLNGAVVIHDARDLKTLLKRDGTVIVDVSNAPIKPDNLAAGAPWLPVPHQAIPGSLWIPGVGLGEVPPSVGDFFRRQLAVATGNDPARPLIIYCHEKCWLSWNATKRAISYGYRHVYWYRDGIEGWKAAGFQTAVIEPKVAPED